MARRGEVWHGVAGEARLGSAWQGWFGTARQSFARFGVAGVARSGLPRLGEAWRGAVWQGRRGLVGYGEVRRSTARHGLAGQAKTNAEMNDKTQTKGKLKWQRQKKYKSLRFHH